MTLSLLNKQLPCPYLRNIQRVDVSKAGDLIIWRHDGLVVKQPPHAGTRVAMNCHVKLARLSGLNSQVTEHSFEIRALMSDSDCCWNFYDCMSFLNKTCLDDVCIHSWLDDKAGITFGLTGHVDGTAHEVARVFLEYLRDGERVQLTVHGDLESMMMESAGSTRDYLSILKLQWYNR